MSVSPFLEQLRTVASSPYALIGYTIVVIVWGFTVNRAIRIKAISRAIGQLPEPDRKSILEKEYGYHLKQGMSAKHFLRAQRSTYIFYGFLALVVTGLIISVVAMLRAQTQVVDSRQVALCSAMQEIIGQIDEGFKKIRGDRVIDRDDPTAVEYESTVSVPESTLNTIDLSENEPSLAANLYYGQDARVAYQTYNDFIRKVQDCTRDWMMHPDVQDNESLERSYVSFVKGSKKVIVSLKKYTDEPQPRYYVTVLFCRISMDDDADSSSSETPRPARSPKASDEKKGASGKRRIHDR